MPEANNTGQLTTIEDALERPSAAVSLEALGTAGSVKRRMIGEIREVN